MDLLMGDEGWGGVLEVGEEEDEEKEEEARARAAVVVVVVVFSWKKKLACEQAAPQNHGAPPSTSSWSTVKPVASSRQQTCVPESWHVHRERIRESKGRERSPGCRSEERKKSSSLVSFPRSLYPFFLPPAFAIRTWQQVQRIIVRGPKEEKEEEEPSPSLLFFFFVFAFAPLFLFSFSSSFSSSSSAPPPSKSSLPQWTHFPRHAGMAAAASSSAVSILFREEEKVFFSFG